MGENSCRFQREFYSQRSYLNFLQIKHVTFLVDLQSLAHPKLCHRDSHGRWAAPSQATHFYRTDDSDQSVERIDTSKHALQGTRCAID